MIHVQDGTRVFIVTGRIAAMIRCLVERTERLNALPKMRLEFNRSGFKRVQPKLEVVEDEVPIQ